MSQSSNSIINDYVDPFYARFLPIPDENASSLQKGTIHSLRFVANVVVTLVSLVATAFFFALFLIGGLAACIVYPVRFTFQYLHSGLKRLHDFCYGSLIFALAGSYVSTVIALTTLSRSIPCVNRDFGEELIDYISSK